MTALRWNAVFVAAASVLSMTATAHASPPSIEASLRDGEVAVGEPTELVLTIEGAPDATPSVPRTRGVDVSPTGTSRRVEVVNGAMRETVAHHYRVIASRAGRFELGPFTVAGARAPSVSLAARASSAPERSASRGEGAGGRAMLRVRLGKRELVLGESVPVTIRAYVKAGTAGTITGAPELGSDAFAIHDLVDDAQQGQTVIDGTPYATLTWRGRITPLLPGDHDVSATLPATLRWRERVRRPMPPDPFEDRFDSLFDRFANDPFFRSSPFARQRAEMEDLFTTSMGPERSADVVLRHRLGRVRVVEPPAEDRPADFEGAVGSFTMRGEITSDRVRAGEPFTLRLTIEGEGTFERVTHELLSDQAGRLRAYPAASRFVDRGADGRRGTMVIEQSVVPLAPGRLELAPLAFSYYDPARAEYVTLRTEPLVIDVDPSEDGSTPVLDLSDAAATQGAIPLRATPGRFVEQLWPVPRSPWWLLAVGLTMALAVGSAILIARRDPKTAALGRARRRAQRSVARARRRMRSRARRGTAALFYEAARAYAQAHLGTAWGIAPAAVTLAEARARMTAVPDALVEVFERADAIQFAGHEPPAEDLRAWSACLERALDREVTP